MNIENLSAEDKHGQRTQNIKKEMQTMSTNTSNHLVNPAAREAMDKFKMEAAAEVGVNLKNGYNGELTSRQAGSVGGQMVNKMSTIRTMRFIRSDRTALAHMQEIKYIASIIV